MKKPKPADTRLRTGPQGPIGITGIQADTGYTLESALEEIWRLNRYIQKQYGTIYHLKSKNLKHKDEIKVLKKRIKNEKGAKMSDNIDRFINQNFALRSGSTSQSFEFVCHLCHHRAFEAEKITHAEWCLVPELISGRERIKALETDNEQLVGQLLEQSDTIRYMHERIAELEAAGDKLCQVILEAWPADYGDIELDDAIAKWQAITVMAKAPAEGEKGSE